MKGNWACLAAILVIVLYGNAQSADLEKFVVTRESPVCGVMHLSELRVSVCEFDDAKRASGNCQENVPVHQTIRFKACAHIANGPFPPNLPDQTGAIVGGAHLKRALLALGNVAWPYSNFSPAGPFMPEGACREIGKKLVPLFSNPMFPGVFRKLDGDMPGWRECMNKLAQSIKDNLGDSPEIIELNRLHVYLGGLDIANPVVQAKLDAFVLAIEEEPTQPVSWVRAMQLLGLH